MTFDDGHGRCWDWRSSRDTRQNQPSLDYGCKGGWFYFIFSVSFLTDLNPYLSLQQFSSRIGGVETMQKAESDTFRKPTSVFEGQNRQNWNNLTVIYLLKLGFVIATGTQTVTSKGSPLRAVDLKRVLFKFFHLLREKVKTYRLIPQYPLIYMHKKEKKKNLFGIRS